MGLAHSRNRLKKAALARLSSFQGEHHTKRTQSRVQASASKPITAPLAIRSSKRPQKKDSARNRAASEAATGKSEAVRAANQGAAAQRRACGERERENTLALHRHCYSGAIASLHGFCDLRSKPGFSPLFGK